MADRNFPVYLKDPDGNPVRVGWAGPEPEDESPRDVQIDTDGPGRDAYFVARSGPAQGFTYGPEEVFVDGGV